jgi:hypothetical protein
VKAVRVVVVVENGRLVGTHVAGGGKHDPMGPSARILAGPGQELREIDVERPDDLARPGAVEEFHALVRRTAGLT